MTLPSYVWVIYYGLLALTVIYGIIFIVKGNINRLLSTFAVILSIVLVFVFMMYSMERKPTHNEFEHFFYGLREGIFVAWFLLCVLLYIGFWWFRVLQNAFKK
ncbi:hypothetical protein [Radiobacillus deserti]|uniref:Uncharacterized protein n=1 Tax=Radiobacillus deserti TaxID=2594883 RepID=A0A516KKN0_9BACI|nr:hypothetical protein [Radiobacillus deserti]QDP41954.1 hypothetical protein FN924_18335 [Radiobacillus deserti]